MTTPDPGPAEDTGLDQRVTSLEHGQVSILGKLDQLLGMGTREPERAEPERPEVSIAEEIRKQLAERDAKAKPEPAAPKPADLAEKPPKAPVRRVTKALWGGDE